MNFKNLHELINRYEENFEMVNNSVNDEIFKWKAVRYFNKVWNDEANRSMTFSKLFSQAKKESFVMIDNSRVSPTNGIVKMAERRPQEVEHLFKDVLWADDGGDIVKRHNNMEKFLYEIELIRQKEFPNFWKYKQDRHAASCYLVFNDPEHNYIYRYSEAETFAQYVEFEMDIGLGENFRLERYYALCDVIVEALKEHPSLLEKHFELIKDNDEYYHDDSLHIMAFDLMYCSRTYDFYSGLEHISKKETVANYKLDQLRKKEREEKEKQISEVKAEIQLLQNELSDIEDISLLGVEVYQNRYGSGIVVEHNKNRIKVHFDGVDKIFTINKKFAMRPTFEDDEEIVDMYTKYADDVEKIKSLELKLVQLENIKA